MSACSNTRACARQIQQATNNVDFPLCYPGTGYPEETWTGQTGHVQGLIPTSWWPSAIAPSADGSTLSIANASGRDALPSEADPPNNLGSPKSSTMGTENIFPVPSAQELAALTKRVLMNNGFVPSTVPQDDNPIPSRPGVARQQN